jgi:putative membrane protein
MMGYYDYGYYPRHDGFETIIAVLCWVAVITFVVYVVKRFGVCHGKHCGRYKELGGTSAMDILKERYAKGEIEKKEFEEKKKDLAE